MSGDSSEEKTLPPSKKKLLDARKKGQVPHSKDLVGAATLGASVGMSWAAVGSLFALGAAMMDAAGNAGSLGLGPGLRSIGSVLQTTFMSTAVPVLAAVVVAALVGNIVVLRGLVFATDPITPKLSNVNPAEGFKKLFNMKALVELLKNLFKMVLLSVVLGLTLWGGLRAMAMAPGCGFVCVLSASRALIMALLIASVLVFILAGGADILLQRWLFTRDQKMGVSEQKREYKEQEGDPHINAERKRTMREAVDAPARLGLRQASLLLHDGAGNVVGLRFVQGEMPVPMVVCRARGDRGMAMLGEGRGQGLPVTENRSLVGLLLKGAPPGAYIPEASYQAAAMVLAQHGLV